MRPAIIAAILFAILIAGAFAASGDSREDPVPVSEWGEVGEYRVRVIGYNPDYTAQVLDYLGDGEPPREGYVFAAVRVEVEYSGDGIGQAANLGEPSFIDSGSVELTRTACGDATTRRINGGEERADLFPGGVVTITYCAEVTAKQAGELTMYFSLPGEAPVFFALEPTPLATPEASPVT